MTGKRVALILGFISWLSILVSAWLLLLGIVERNDVTGWSLVVFLLIGFVSSLWAASEKKLR